MNRMDATMGTGWRVCADELERALVSASPVAPASVPQQAETGTFACPVCGLASPHGHTDSDIFNWLDAQGSRFGYRLHDRNWTVRPVDGQSGRIEHAIHRLGEETFGATPIGRRITEILQQELPNVRAREAASIVLTGAPSSGEPQQCGATKEELFRFRCNKCGEDHEMVLRQP